jgi:hypothetical protein
MKPQLVLLPLAAAIFSACGTPETEGEAAEARKPAFKGTRVWNVGGMTIGNRMSSTVDPISEQPIGPGGVEEELATTPGEPLPEGTTPTLDANILPDGAPAEPAEPLPQSPFDPALKNPPEGTAPAAPGTGAEIPPPAPVPAAPATGTPAPSN